MKMYVVTSGEFIGSYGYYIEGMFTDKEKAEEYAEWCGNDFRVEEYYNMDNFEYQKCYKVSLTCNTLDGTIIDISILKRNRLQDEFVVVRRNFNRTIVMVRYIKKDNWNEDVKEKYIEQLKDIYEFFKSKNKLTDREITRMIKINDK